MAVKKAPPREQKCQSSWSEANRKALVTEELYDEAGDGP